MSTEVPLGTDLKLDFAVLELTKDTLRVRYEAENVGASDLYLFNRLYRTYTDEGVFELDPDLVYVYPEDGVAHLTKRIPDIPRGIHVEIPIVPCVTVLSRGRRLSESMSLRLPLRQHDPYRPEETPAIQGFDSVVFSLGYFRASEIGKRPVNYVRTTQGQALHAYVTPWDQLFARTAPVEARSARESAAEQTRCPRCGAALPPGSRFCNQCGSPV